jgi:hypothetical protein
MGQHKKPRNKRYRPRACTPLDGYMKLTRAAVARVSMSNGDAGELELVVLTALDAIAHGKGTPDEWNSLARGINHSWGPLDSDAVYRGSHCQHSDGLPGGCRENTVLNQ